MRIRLSENVFIRHAEDETLLFSPRTGGCSVLSNAQVFVDELAHTWRSLDDIIHDVAEQLGLDIHEISRGAKTVYDELISQGFAQVDDVARNPNSKMAPRASITVDDAEDDMPLSDFYRRHGNLPIEFHVDLTDACTERCVHCYVPQRQNHFLPYAYIEKAIGEFRNMQGLSVHLTGGEAMMHPDFKAICQFCKDLNLNILIFSNLTLCDSAMVAFLQEVNPQFVNVSLYAMDPNVHDRITCVPGSWRRTMDAILECEKSGVHIRIATPLLKENKNEFGKLLQFTNKHRMHLIPSYDIVPRSNHDRSNLSHSCTGSELRNVLKENKVIFDEGFGLKQRCGESKVCSIGAARLYLNAQGYYYPCDTMHEYVLGDVRTESFETIWHGDALTKLRSLRDADFPSCSSCPHRAYCKVCPAFNFNASGNLFAVCPEKCEVAKIVHDIYGD